MTDNLIVYAKWLPPTYDIKIHTEGGTLTPNSDYEKVDSQTFEHTADEGETLNNPGTPTRDGYKFAGWYYTNSQGNEVEYLFSESQKVYSDLDIYAKWNAEDTGYYTIKYIEAQYDENGNIITDVSKYTNINYLADSVTKGPVKYGTEVDAEAAYIAPVNGTSYIVDETNKKIKVTYGENNEIYFIYTPVDKVSYTVYYLKRTYDEQGKPISYNSGDVPPESEYLSKKVIREENFLDSTTVKEYAPIIDGYEADAYSKEMVLTTNQKNMTADQNAIYFYYVPVENTGDYEINYYFMDSDGNYPSTPNKIVKDKASVGTFIKIEDYDKYLPVNENKELYSGHELDYETSNVLMVIVSSVGTSQLNIYFKNIDYTFSYDTQGGDWTDTSDIYTPKTLEIYETKIKYNEKATKPSDPVKDGYRFGGWYKDTTFTTPYDFETQVTGDTRVYAKWIELKNITVKKVWDDSNNQDGKRVDSVSVNIIANGNIVSTISLTSENNFCQEVKNLDKFDDSENEIEYSIEETTDIDGYTKSYSSKDNVYTVTNTHIPETKKIKIIKKWNDENNQDGIRPSEIQLNLKQNENILEQIKLDNSSWQKEVEVPVYIDGKKAQYSIEEFAVNGYTTSTTQTEDTIEITNTHIPETKSITINKIWNDENNKDGLRPSSISVSIKNGEKVVNTIVISNTNWIGKTENLPVYSNGTKINYAIEENVPNGYEASYNTSGDNFTVTNTHVPEKTTIIVDKIWNDENNQDGIRPDKVSVDLRKDSKTIQTIELSEKNNWHQEISNLDKYSNGTLIEYTLDEEKTNGYQTSIKNQDNHFVITNSHETEKTSVSVEKKWVDNNNQDGIRPENVEVKLYADGTYISSTILDSTNNFKHDFSNLNKNKEGKEINYSVDEENISGYEKSIEKNNDTGVIEITNTHVPEKKSITVSKIWDDDSNRDGKRPDTIAINLKANGNIIDTKSMTKDDNFSDITFSNLDVYNSGNIINYEIEENEINDYSISYNVSGNNVTITNTHIPERIDKTVTKQWRDGSNQEGFRPESITYRLYKNGVKYGEDITLSASDAKPDNSNEWTHTHTNLYKYENGKEIKYTVEELGLKNGILVVDESLRQMYSAIYNQDTLYIYNAYPPEVMVGATKKWDDEENADGTRPENIQIQLKYKSENETGEYHDYIVDGQNVGLKTLNKDNNWTYYYGFLQKYNDKGEKLDYIIEEVNVPEGYKLVGTNSISQDTQFTQIFEITNKLINSVKKTSRTVKKVWNDDENRDGIRPKSVTVHLLANGEEVESKELNDDNNWKYTFENLNANKNGEPIEYSLTEDEVKKYSTNITYDNDSLTFNVENTHNIDTKSIVIKKEWKDNENQDGKRPDSINVDLLANDQKLETISLDNTKNWTHTIENLPVNESGEKIDYTLSEDVPNGYDYQISTNGDEYTIINTHNPETIDINISKIWNDDNNRDGLRPANIEVTLYADGVALSNATNLILNDTNSWNINLSGLPKYTSGKIISYTVEESKINGYNQNIKYDLDNGKIVITNTHTPETKTIKIIKNWNDENNNYNKRIDSIDVEIYANEKFLTTVTLDKNSNYETNIGGVYVYENGEEINYKTKEKTSINSYLASYSNQDDTYTITNNIITYNINTQVNGIGGTISGQNDNPYEKVAGGDSNTKSIIITPNTGYKISNITINGIEQTLPENTTQPYTLPKIENINEDKTIEVKFEKIEYQITTSVVDGNGTISGEGQKPYETVYRFTIDMSHIYRK